MYRFCDGNLNKPCVMWRKGFYSYKCTDSCERLNETPLPIKTEFYRNLTIESITDTNYKHAKRVWEDFRLQSLCQYHNL